MLRFPIPQGVGHEARHDPGEGIVKGRIDILRRIGRAKVKYKVLALPHYIWSRGNFMNIDIASGRMLVPSTAHPACAKHLKLSMTQPLGFASIGTEGRR